MVHIDDTMISFDIHMKKVHIRNIHYSSCLFGVVDTFGTFDDYGWKYSMIVDIYSNVILGGKLDLL